MDTMDSVIGRDVERPSGGLDRPMVVVAGVVTLGLVMAVLDTTIVNVALDTLSRDMHAPLSTIQWVSTCYLLSLAAVIPLSGWITERFGSKRTWIASIVLFAGGSALCALATSAGELIAFRVVRVARRLIHSGPAAPSGRAYLGVDVVTVAAGGVAVAKVLSGGPAARAGIRAGEVIVAVAGRPTRTAEALGSVIDSLRPGRRVDVRLAGRDGGRRIVSVVLARAASS